MGAGSAEGAVDAANILKPALSRGEIRVIGATTLNEYRKYIEKDAALERRFQPVTVGEPTPEATLEILKGLRDKYEAHHRIKIPDEAIEAAVKITDDINARYDAFANAEASLINNALVVPMGMSIPAYIATRLNYWEGQYASTGFSNKRLKGIHVLDHYISMSEYEANRDAR